jgi:hypothetical protein
LESLEAKPLISGRFVSQNNEQTKQSYFKQIPVAMPISSSNVAQ